MSERREQQQPPQGQVAESAETGEVIEPAVGNDDQPENTDSEADTATTAEHGDAPEPWTEEVITDEEAEERRRPFGVVPKIYVASLADYTAGNLHGAWIPADQDEDDLLGEIGRMLETSPLGATRAEEWAIHDYEGFGPVRLYENERMADVSRLVAAMQEHGRAAAYWYDFFGQEDDVFERFPDVYRGEFRSMQAYAEQLVEDIGLQIHVEPENWAHYVSFDYRAMARDLEVELYVAEDPEGGGVYVFDSNG